MLFQRTLLRGVYYGRAGLIYGGVCYWRKFCFENAVGLDNTNLLKTAANPNSLWTYYLGGLIIGRMYACEITCGGI